MSGQDKASRDTGLPWLSAMVAAQLGVDAGSIDPDERLHHYGLTSLTASGLVATLSNHLGRTLPPTLVWDYPTLRGLMAFISGTPDAVTHRSPVPLADDDGIAIVGMACRFPGAESPGAFWHMLCTGTDAIREVPADRWPIDALYDPDPHAPGRMATRWGGFLDSVDRFDAAFFGLSPREAAQADPQQRLGLELAWEALEDAGIRPKHLAGSRTGVFMGAMWSDYARLLQDRDAIAPHTATGQDISIISARIAYVLGLEGPALTINTACSSALVAVHQACRSLRNGESTVALAGGVHLLLAPESSIAMTKFGAMSPDGRCKAFDSRANGYVRGEGGGIVVLKPFSAARADGDRIYAVIRGSAVNNDGPSNGLTAPNPAAQRAMLLDALADARVDASVVDYVEAHGTGTALGDPIEANALAAVLCHTRTAERPLRIGSVKTNIGHLEAAAGAAGLIKLVLALHHRWIPASLHFQAPNPAIDFTGSRMTVQARGDAWPSGSALPIGGVSSFGFGGTNCHVIAQAAPPSGPHAAVLADTRPVFVFAGNGGNWPGMAAGLANHPAFAASLRASDESLAALGYPASVRDLLTNADGRVNDVALGQPALCAFQLAVVAVLADAGVKPSAVVGHSVGEAAAAATAGILTQTEALRLVVTRSRLQAEVAGRGRMALAAADTAAVRRHLPADVVIAGENGPRATLLAGAPDAIDAACDALKAAGIVSQPVLVPVAYHSPQMDALRPKLEQAMQGVQPAAGTVPMASTVHGRMVEGTSLHAAYWGRNLRDPVLFRQAIEALRDAGHRMFLEIAPHPLLGAQVRQMVPDGIVVSPLRRGASDLPALQAALSPLAGERRGVRPRHLLLLSARTQAALDVLARRWADRLPADWADLCHTALVGRERFPWRLALHAADGEEARRRLREDDYLCGEAPRAGLPDFDQRRAPDESWSAWLDRCAQGFIAGADLDGAAFDAGEPWQVIAAPTYPFERERHWLPLPADGLSYELAWEPFRLPSMAGWPDIFPAGDQADPGLDALATRYARDALAMVPDGSIIPRHRTLVRRLAGWSALPGWSALAGPEPRQSAALELLTRVGQSLPGILTGRTDPLEALFPGGALDAAAGVYNAPPFAAAQQALAQIIGLIGAARPLRILELGAGTGALTGRLVAALPPASVLISTDVSAAFLSGLRRRFADAPQVRTAVFDIDHPVGCDGPFDAIVAANVVHAGANLAAILSALRDRLAPGGVLAFVELTRAPRWIDLVFGVTEGWWRFAGDPLRPRGALLDADGWRVVLTAAGFTDVDIRADGDAHAVVLCRAAPVPRRWRLRGGGAARLRIAGSEPATGILFAAGDGNPAEAVAELTTATEAGLPVSVLADTSLAGAACAGAALALALSDGDRIAGTIEVLDDDPASQAAALAAVERGVAEDQLRAADGSLFAGRVVRVQPASPPVRLSPDKLYVLAGGQGRLGFRFAQFLVQRGARHVLLVGRSPAAPGRLAQLNRNGVTARYLALDLSKSGAGEVLAAAFDRGLGGIIHAAGLADGPVDQVIAAKLAVADTLADAARNHVPGFLLLFSSAAGVWGTRGHVAYAAANRALDRWAERARAQGLPATAVAFGRFAEQGLLPDGEVAALEAAGLQAMEPDTAFVAALQAVADGVPHRIVAAVNWPRFAALFSARRQRTLFTRIAPPEAPKPQQAPVLGAAVPVARIAQPATLDLDGLRTLVADVLGHDDPARIDPDRGLFEQGLDSLLAVTLRQRLETASGTPVPAAALFAHPTLSLLAAWLAGHARSVPAPAPGGGRAGAEPVAVIGLGCRFPGNIRTPEDMLPFLLDGRDALCEIPPHRPDAPAWQAALSAIASPLGGFLDDVDLFDPGFFGISPREAAKLDPQQRILLEVAWAALEHAGINPRTLEGSRTAVFVGATGSDYAILSRAGGHGSLDAHSLLGLPSNTLAGRLAYQFGLHGPALTVDTACSSSLVALHLAIRALRQGEAEIALAGGVNLLLAPDTSVVLTRAGLLAPDGHCKVFDADANGYVRGEGCGMAVLKPLARAQRDGDRILAVIRGSAVNHDGRSSSFTAPNGAAQAAVIRAALADGGLHPDQVDLIEAHGTGTALGDPIELDALADVFAPRDRALPVGSVKANIGHTEAAAGIAGVIKAVACLQAGSVPPQAHFTRLNPHAAHPGGPVEVRTQRAELAAGLRRAGVSAFGASGTNAHVVLESTDGLPALHGDGPARLLLSAPTWDALDQLRQEVLAALRTGAVAFADACHTAYIGRARLPFWLLADTPDALATAPVQQGPAPDLPVPRGRRITLPPTPLFRQHCWIEPGVPPLVPSQAVPQAGEDDRRPVLGPPHRSARSGEVVREGRLDPAASWLRDHVIEGATLLPAAGFLVMALDSGAPALCDVAFLRPLDVGPDGAGVQLVHAADGVVTLYAETTSGWLEIATAQIAPAVEEPWSERLPAQAEQITGAAFADELAGRGFAFGPAYGLLEHVSRAGPIAEAMLRPVPGAPGRWDPMLMDAAIQALTATLPAGTTPWLPARIARVVAGDSPAGPLLARARLRASGINTAVGDAVLTRSDGTPVLRLDGIELRPAQAQPGAWYHDVVWRPAAAAPTALIGRWHAIGPGADTLSADMLGADMLGTDVLGIASRDPGGNQPVPPVDGIIDLRPLRAETPDACLSDALALVRHAAALSPPPQVVFVSRGASAAPPVLAGPVPAGAVLMGLQPVIAAEQPALRCRWVDLDPDESGIPAALGGDAGRFAIRQGRLLAPEVVKSPPEPDQPVRLTPGPDRSYADLRLVPDAGRPPGQGEVQIAVSAAGLNFKDTLAVIGRAPGGTEPLGLECAGRVLAVGAGADNLAAGDPVLAFGRGALASRLTVPAAQVVRRPAWLDEDSAASLVVAALTAWHGLHDIAAIRAGMRVLIHAAAGGVGCMAVQLARLAGARVFATASAGKQPAALAAGADAVGDSRSPTFADAARQWAGTDRFDVVLHALGPDMAAASAALLRPDGVFLELGNAPRPAGFEGRHVAYNLDQPMQADGRWFADRIARVLDLIEAGSLQAPRRTVWPLGLADEALQALGQGRTIGKLVLRFPATPLVRPDGDYLITGGTGGVGRALGAWLKDAGARRVVLASRHPTPVPGFETVAADVSERDAVARLLAGLPDLRGVIHAAGAVHDHPVHEATPADITATLAGKTWGAAHLDDLTRGRDLDFLLLVSSSTGSLGQAGQAVYAGANAWLDRLAAARRAAGLPCAAVASGPWQGGMFARLPAASRLRLEQAGLRPMAPRRAAAAVVRALGSGAAHRLVMDRTPPAVAEAPPGSSIRATLLSAPPAQRQAVLEAELARRVASLLGFPSGTKLDPARPLRDLGLDSLLTVSLRNELAAATGLDLPTTLAFDHPALGALARHLLGLLEDPEPALEALGEAELADLLARELEARP